MKHIMPIRKSLPHRTIFNILGPLTNPAGSRKYLIGVFSDAFLDRIIAALRLLDTKSAVAVSSKEGMDEISISDVTYAAHLQNGVVKEFEIDPSEYGIRKNLLSSIKGGDAAVNGGIIMDIFDGTSSDAQRDIVLLNAGVALYVDGLARDIKEGIDMALDTLEFSLAKMKLLQIAEVAGKL
jgi:anthranilate phosphoribosyltransferase